MITARPALPAVASAQAAAVLVLLVRRDFVVGTLEGVRVQAPRVGRIQKGEDEERTRRKPCRHQARAPRGVTNTAQASSAIGSTPTYLHSAILQI